MRKLEICFSVLLHRIVSVYYKIKNVLHGQACHEGNHYIQLSDHFMITTSPMRNENNKDTLLRGFSCDEAD